MSDPVFIFDVHLDLSMNALEWNRDLRFWSLERIRRHEMSMKDRVGPGQQHRLPPRDAPRPGRALCGDPDRPVLAVLPPAAGLEFPEQAWAQTQGQLAWYRAMEKAGEMVSIRDRADLDRHLALSADQGPRARPEGVSSRARPAACPSATSSASRAPTRSSR